MDVDVSLRQTIRSGTDETVRRRQDCPDEQRLAGFADGGLDQADRIRLQSHLADCDHCLRILALLGRITQAGPPEKVPVDLEVAAREMRFRPTSAPGSKAAWSRVAAAALILVFASVAVWKLDPERGTDSDVRSPVTSGSPSDLVPGLGGRGPEILVPSAGATVPVGGVAFQWTQVPTAVSYSVRIVTLDGDIVWEDKVFTTETHVPPRVELHPDETYLVRVSAHLTGGKTFDSEHVRFFAGRGP